MSENTPDPQAILRALGWSARAETIVPVAGGWDTTLWRVERGGQTYALRLFRAGEDAVARREERAMRLAVPGVPIPMVRAAGVWEERPALLIDWCAGRTLFDALRADPRRAWALAHTFGATQARLHAAAPPAALQETGRSWIDWKGGGAGALGARLRAVASDRPSVLHLDYHPLNVMVDAGRVTGLIDWANIHVGDRRADVARTLAILLLSPLPPDGPVRLIRALSRLLVAGWRRGYRAVAGPLGGMAPFYAWAGTALPRGHPERPGVCEATSMSDQQLPRSLTKGANVGLRDLDAELGSVTVVLESGGTPGKSVAADVSVLLLDEHGNVASDDNLVFYNQPVALGGAVHLRERVRTGSESSSDETISADVITLVLDDVPEDVHRIVVAGSLDQDAGVTFGDAVVLGLKLQRTADAADVVSFPIEGATTETTLLFAEFYRRQGDWRVRAVGQGYDGGLAALNRRPRSRRCRGRGAGHAGRDQSTEPGRCGHPGRTGCAHDAVGCSRRSRWPGRPTPLGAPPGPRTAHAGRLGRNNSERRHRLAARAIVSGRRHRWRRRAGTTGHLGTTRGAEPGQGIRPRHHHPMRSPGRLGRDLHRSAIRARGSGLPPGRGDPSPQGGEELAGGWSRSRRPPANSGSIRSTTTWRSPGRRLSTPSSPSATN